MNHPDKSSPIFGHIDAEHAKMRDLLSELHHILADRSQTHANVLSAIDAFVAYLRDHFEHEEKGGFFGEITAVAPRLSNRAAEVSEEHVSLLAAMEKYRESAQQGMPNDEWWDRLNSEFHLLMKDLMHHEHREQELLQDAFVEDIGTGD